MTDLYMLANDKYALSRVCTTQFWSLCPRNSENDNPSLFAQTPLVAHPAQRGTCDEPVGSWSVPLPQSSRFEKRRFLQMCAFITTPIAKGVKEADRTVGRLSRRCK